MILLCKDPLGTRTPDLDYVVEAEGAQAVGFVVGLLDFEALTFEGNPRRALRYLQPPAASGAAIYRGWMLGQDRYEQLYAALQSLGLSLINDPSAYRFCHHLPGWYATLAEHTPRSVCIPTEGPVSISRLMEELSPFGDRPVIVKDWVKSQKHHWEEACYIPRASDPEAVQRIVGRFLQLQGTELTGGLVFREFIELAKVGTHPRSGMPLTCEYRLFFLDGACFYHNRYWSDGEYPDDALPLPQFEALAGLVRSRFFTMDVAKTAENRWIVIELGDGQVAGSPDESDAAAFYRALADCWQPIPAP